jgi:hypothetical protein
LAELFVDEAVEVRNAMRSRPYGREDLPSFGCLRGAEIEKGHLVPRGSAEFCVEAGDIVRPLKAELLDQYIDHAPAKIVGAFPLLEPDILAGAGADDLVEHIVLARRYRRAAEPLGELEVLTVCTGLPTANREFGIA